MALRHKKTCRNKFTVSSGTLMFRLKEKLVKLQYTTPRRFRVGSARSAKKTKTNLSKVRTNPKYEQTQNTKGFRSPRLQGIVYCNLAEKCSVFRNFFDQ